MTTTGRIMAPQSRPHPGPQNLWNVRLPGKGGAKEADRIKVASQLTLKWGEYPGESRWAWYNHKGFL